MTGLRIHPRVPGALPELLARFRTLPVANVSDTMGRLAGADAGLRPWHNGGVLCGPAFTVRTRPGDNLMVHKALDMAEPGDVLVVDGGGETANALVGELMLAHAMRRGLAGVVIHGAVRDLDWIRRTGMPVYACGVTHRGPYKNGPGQINVAISVSGMVVRPGDVVLGDSAGVVCIPLAQAETVCAAAEAKAAAEERQMSAILAGTVDRSWIDTELARQNCDYPDGPEG